MNIRTFITMLLTVTATTVAVAVTPVLSLPMEMDSEHQVTDTISWHSYTVRGKHACSVPAAIGNGLRTDGYSSYVQIPLSNYELSTSQLTISLLTACQTYPMMNANEADNKMAAIISCLDDSKKQGFAFYLFSQGKFGFSIYINGEKKTITPSTFFPQYEWVHLCATVDGESGTIALYQNGQKVASNSYAQGTITPMTGNLFLGKSYKDVLAGQFYLNTYNGILDDIQIYNAVLSESEIQDLANVNYQLSTVNSLNYPQNEYFADINRPRHHAMPASNWMNESHGMTYSDGRYHVFFQKNANGPYMARLHWGHVSSPDLCNWTEERIALVPGKSYDIKGCWSGCVFSDEAITGGNPYILYTGVDNGRATINLASPQDSTLILWNKSSLNPVINGTPAGYSADFRDPYFFRSGDEAYCIVGTSRGGVASTSLHRYNASTGVFDYTGYPFFTGSDVERCGSFFEMPNMTRMDDRWLFTATPLGTAHGVRTIYYVGSVNEDGTFLTDQSEPLTVELPGFARDGYGLLSPTIYQHNGKTLVLGIVPDKLATSINYNLGYAHTLSLPREWSLAPDGTLIQRPYEGLQALRSDTSVTIDAQTLSGDLSLEPVSGREIEVRAQFVVAEAAFGIKFLTNDAGRGCRVYYDPATARITLDCSNLTRRVNDQGVFDGIYTSELPATVQAGDTMTLHLFFDHSVLDLFINDRWASSVRIFPTSESSVGVSLFADDATPLLGAEAWTMRPGEADFPPEPLPEPTDLQEEISTVNGQLSTVKVLRDGHILVLRGDDTYTLLGEKIE